MGDFDDLPDPKTIQHGVAARHAVTQAKLVRCLRESQPLFIEMATRLRDVEPSCTFGMQQKVQERYGLFGRRTRERMTWVHTAGWNLGFSGDHGPPAYLLTDGSVYPSIETGVSALLGDKYHCFFSDDPALVSQARSLLIEALKKKYREWCVTRRR